MESNKKLVLTLSSVLAFAAILVVLIAVFLRTNVSLSGLNPVVPGPGAGAEQFGKMEQFKTEAEFREYMQSASGMSNYFGGGFGDSRVMLEKSAPSMTGETSSDMIPMAGGGSMPERISGTNTQVLGIDEPDIVKTDGETIYYSTPFYDWQPEPIPLKDSINEPVEAPINGVMNESPPLFDDAIDAREEKKVVDSQDSLMYPPINRPRKIQNGGILSIKAYPPSDMSLLKTLSTSGDLLLNENTLIVFNETNYDMRSVDGYDISDPSKPEKKWSIPFKQNNSKVQARLYKDKLYLITRFETVGNYPCPLKPFDMKSNDVTINCTDIYHPIIPVPSDTIYTVSKVNATSGIVEKNISFVGSYGEMTVYMSRGSLYLGYPYNGDMVSIIQGFVSQNRELFTESFQAKLKRLKDYDLNYETKMMELNILLSRFTLGMDEDERLAFENNLQNKMKDYMKTHARSLEKTGLVKVNIESMRIDATGDIPGRLHNQFSLDEYDNTLRAATTVGQNNWLGQFGQLTESFSDVYVLNGDLNVIGSVVDLGKKEQIYSVRFMGSRAYVVTFRQTDPFYVLDLSNPRNPTLKGELKIPGYSSYLHPLTKDIILGIGQEDSNIKLSLFDVSNPSDPQEIDKYSMKEYWSEALNNHHAFLADEKHEVFFMPGSRGGYIFSYEGNKLTMIKAIADYQVQRAVYINDYFYVVGQNTISVYDETRWEKVKELDL